jgi:formate hydrogenlyase subunit 3/multisubunit Na+/H+ antiporter MnhD subunit
MAYSSTAETGFSLLALSIDSRVGIPILFLLIPARTLALTVWALALTVLNGQTRTLKFRESQGALRTAPFAGVGILLATLSVGAFPLLAGFPARFALWEAVARISINSALWMGVGTVGLLFSAFRSFAALSMAEEYTGWESRENPIQRIMLGLGVIGLFVLGLFPQSVQYFLSDIPLMFEHLGR